MLQFVSSRSEVIAPWFALWLTTKLCPRTFPGVGRSSFAYRLVTTLTSKQAPPVLASVEIHEYVGQMVVARSLRSISLCEKSRKYVAWDGTAFTFLLLQAVLFCCIL